MYFYRPHLTLHSVPVDVKSHCTCCSISSSWLHQFRFWWTFSFHEECIEYMPLDKAPSNQKSILMFFLLKYLVSIATYIAQIFWMSFGASKSTHLKSIAKICHGNICLTIHCRSSFRILCSPYSDLPMVVTSILVNTFDIYRIVKVSLNWGRVCL